MGKEPLVYCNYRYRDRRKTNRWVVYRRMYNGTKRFAVPQFTGKGHEVVEAHFACLVKFFYCEIPKAVLEDTSWTWVMATGKCYPLDTTHKNLSSNTDTSVGIPQQDSNCRALYRKLCCPIIMKLHAHIWTSNDRSDIEGSFLTDECPSSALDSKLLGCLIVSMSPLNNILGTFLKVGHDCSNTHQLNPLFTTLLSFHSLNRCTWGRIVQNNVHEGTVMAKMKGAETVGPGCFQGTVLVFAWYMLSKAIREVFSGCLTVFKSLLSL